MRMCLCMSFKCAVVKLHPSWVHLYRFSGIGLLSWGLASGVIWGDDPILFPVLFCGNGLLEDVKLPISWLELWLTTADDAAPPAWEAISDWLVSCLLLPPVDGDGVPLTSSSGIKTDVEAGAGVHPFLLCSTKVLIEVKCEWHCPQMWMSITEPCAAAWKNKKQKTKKKKKRKCNKWFVTCNLNVKMLTDYEYTRKRKGKEEEGKKRKREGSGKEE